MPERLWIGQTPRRWPTGGRPWCDLADLSLRVPSTASEVRAPLSPDSLSAPDKVETLYLPPVSREVDQAYLEGFALRQLAAGIPVLRQRWVQKELPQSSFAKRVSTEDLLRSRYFEILDPVAHLLAGSLNELVDSLDRTFARHRAAGIASGVVWPLLPGASLGRDRLLSFAEQLKGCGCTIVQPVCLGVEPSAKRALFEQWPEAFDFQALFAVAINDERWAREAECLEVLEQVGLQTSVPRLHPAGLSPRQLRCRQIAQSLALRGEQLARAGASPAVVQSFYSASSTVEETRFDVDALRREGNLAFLGVDAEPLEYLGNLEHDDG